MEFVDYYAVLNLPTTARTKDVQEALEKIIAEKPAPDDLLCYAKAYGVLHNRYKRARYDKMRGELLVVQITPRPYLSAIGYQVNSLQPYAALQGLIEKFKLFIQKKQGLDWQEAQLAEYSYYLENNHEQSYVLFRFPLKTMLESFVQYLMEGRLVKHENA